MLNVYLNKEQFKYEITEMIKLFTKIDEVNIIDNMTLANSQSFLLFCDFDLDSKSGHIYLKMNKEILFEEYIDLAQVDYKTFKNVVKSNVFKALVKVYDYSPPWGILTGIRPSKVVNELIDEGYTVEEIKDLLKNIYMFDQDKIELLLTICHNERKILENMNDNEISIYIGIPFCPTKCKYCSFTSYKATQGALDAYLEALLIEITEVGKIINERKLGIETVYIGGGTPTSLDARQLDLLITHLSKHMDLSNIKEFTVECGRPDTIDEEKLLTLKRHGVDRISINPQTMKENTLIKIGRDHSSKDIIDSYELAEKIGFKSINMDLIIGLPDESPDDYKKTLQKTIDMAPENITVHTLALKNQSQLNKEGKYDVFGVRSIIENMLKTTQTLLKNAGYIPYYMYRQKHIAGNYENVGYSKKDNVCIYNIRIIEEKQSIIALGAGGVSKAFYPEENRFERVPNVNNYEVYIDRIDEMINRKRKEFLR